MRTVNSIKNIITSLGGQLLTLLLQFVSRTVFIHTLGVEYLGISGLFTNVISILNITELGIGTAIAYSLYKPLAEKDVKRIQANMNLLKKAYFWVGCIIAGLGLILIPFLPHIMKGTTNLVNVNVIYVLYVFQSVSSYWFFAYKSSLIQADQKKFVNNIIRYSVTLLTTVVQIVLLVLFKSFLVYTIIGITSNLTINVLVARKVDKLYPYVKGKNDQILSKEERKSVFKNIFGMSMYKINSVIVSSTDNIVISTFISVVAVGFYSNYILIASSITTIAKLCFSGITASVGNLFASESKKKNEFIFRCLCFASFWIYGFCAICLWILFNPFITLWVGKDFLLGDSIVLLIVLNFIMEGYQNISITFKDACGLFWQGKYRPVATAILNIVISLILAPRLGIAGVLLGTIISRLVTTWWFEPWMVYKYAFNMSSKKYFIRYLFAITAVILIAGLIQIMSIPMSESTWLNLLIKAVFCISIPNGVFFLIFRTSDEFKYVLGIVKQITQNRKVN